MGPESLDESLARFFSTPFKKRTKDNFPSVVPTPADRNGFSTSEARAIKEAYFIINSARRDIQNNEVILREKGSDPFYLFSSSSIQQHYYHEGATEAFSHNLLLTNIIGLPDLSLTVTASRINGDQNDPYYLSAAFSTTDLVEDGLITPIRYEQNRYYITNATFASFVSRMQLYIFTPDIHVGQRTYEGEITSIDQRESFYDLYMAFFEPARNEPVSIQIPAFQIDRLMGEMRMRPM